jgi:hypothetical protein
MAMMLTRALSILPVKSFDVALQKLPYGTAGVNGGNAYGLIMLKPGYYETATGFQQYINRWTNGNGGFRNVSVEGMGDVTIGGTATVLLPATICCI